jgi:AcrR family transcriptional regulator
MQPRRKIDTKIKDKKLAEERLERIFHAAAELIQEKGYHNTTLRDISKLSGIGLGNLYDYIGSKEDILYLVHEKTASLIADATQTLEAETLGPKEKLAEMIKKELETRDQYQGLVLCIYQESHALEKSSLVSMLQREQEHVDRFRRIIQEGIDAGVFVRFNPVMLSYIIMMMIDGWVLKRWALRGKVKLREMSEGIVEIVMRGILSVSELS